MSSKINEWLSTFTNIGVILGLAVLVYEVQLANESLDRELGIHAAEVNAATVSGWENIDFALIQDGELADIWHRGHNRQELSPVEQIRFNLLLNRYIFQFRRVYEQYYYLTGDNPDWVINITIPGILIDAPAILPQLKMFMEEDPTVMLYTRIREINPPWLRRVVEN